MENGERQRCFLLLVWQTLAGPSLLIYVLCIECELMYDVLFVSAEELNLVSLWATHINYQQPHLSSTLMRRTGGSHMHANKECISHILIYTHSAMCCWIMLAKVRTEHLLNCISWSMSSVSLCQLNVRVYEYHEYYMSFINTLFNWLLGTPRICHIRNQIDQRNPISNH